MYPEVGRENGWCVGIKVLNYTQSSEIPLAIWLQNIPVQSGESYLIGGWIKTDNVEGQGGAMIVPQWRGSGDVWISLTPVMPYIKGTNGWTYYQGSVTAPPGAITCTLSCMMAECTGTSWYDDLLFKQE